MNKCLFIGTLVKDTELLKSKTGTEYLRNTIAINKRSKNKFGEFMEETLFLDFIMFSFNAINASKYLNKGDKIFLEGELKQNDYENSNGQKVKSFSLNVSNFELLKSKNKIKEAKKEAEEGEEEIPF